MDDIRTRTSGARNDAGTPTASEAPNTEPEPQAQPSAPAPPVPETPPVAFQVPETWKSLEDVKFDGVPEAMRPALEHVHGLAREYRDALDEQFLAGKAELDKRMEVFNGLIRQLEENGATDAAPLTQQVEELTTQLTETQTEMGRLQWDSFVRGNDAWTRAPDNVKAAMATVLETPNFPFQSKDVPGQLKEAFEYACFRTGWNPKPADSPAPIAQAPAKPAAPTAPRATPQQLPPSTPNPTPLSTGSRATSPTNPQGPRNPKDVLDRHDRALSGMRDV